MKSTRIRGLSTWSPCSWPPPLAQGWGHNLIQCPNLQISPKTFPMIWTRLDSPHILSHLTCFQSCPSFLHQPCPNIPHPALLSAAHSEGVMITCHGIQFTKTPERFSCIFYGHLHRLHIGHQSGHIHSSWLVVTCSPCAPGWLTLWPAGDPHHTHEDSVA